MNKWLIILALCLVSSLTLNIYLLSQFTEQQSPIIEKQIQNLTDNLFELAPDEPSPQQTQFTERSLDNLDNSPNIANPAGNNSRAELLTQARTWLENKNLLQLGAFLQSYLRDYPQDMDFLLLEAKLNVETILLSDSIAYYYDLLRHPMTPAQQDEVEQQIATLSSTTIEQLKRNYSWDILAIFVEPLLQLDPSNRLYIVSLAQAYAELFQQGLMENVLASLPFDDPEANKIRRILIAQRNTPENNDEDSQQPTDTTANVGRAVPLKQFGDQYVVNASLSSNPVELLIDTGASITAVSRQYFANLSNRYKVNYLGRFSIGTAGGTVMARIYQFRELTINHVTVENLPVVILPMEGIENADGLLGMNFLREFDFKIDQRQAVMFIE